MFTDVNTAAERSTLLTGYLLMSALLQNEAAADWMFTDVSTAAEQNTLLPGC
jgi:hypothetical protein